MESVKENEIQQSQFERGLLKFAEKWEKDAARESSLTHKQILLGTGAAAIVGAIAVVGYQGPDVNVEVLRDTLVNHGLVGQFGFNTPDGST